MKMIDALFNKLLMVYGNEWHKKWEGMPLDEVKANWEEELSGLTVDQIKYGLTKLSDRAPNLIQFKALCQHAPVYFDAPQLSYRPKVNQEKRAALLAALGE